MGRNQEKGEIFNLVVVEMDRQVVCGDGDIRFVRVLFFFFFSHRSYFNLDKAELNTDGMGLKLVSEHSCVSQRNEFTMHPSRLT